MRGGSAANGSQGGTAFAYSGTGAMVQVGDPTYATDTPGFHMDNVVINTTGSASASTQGFAAYRTQEMDLEDMYFLGNLNQTGMTLDGTGNYAGGTFRGDQFSGFQTAVNAIGHQITNPATTDWMNASTFIRLHIDCPTNNGNPIAGTYGINLQQGDGNTFTGGDVEGCSTALHLGPNAQNNTIVGLRNENSTNQVTADAGSSYNNWMTGGTMYTGKLTDNGTRNSFLDTFHRSFNGLNGDWYGSQQDATVTNHFRLGVGAGNERGLQDRYQTDYGYRWTTGLSDATAGEQFYQILDELNNVYRLSIGQYNSGQSSTNNQTVINSAGTGAVVLNGSNGSGTGGVIFGSGGASESTVGTISNEGNAQFNGTLLVGGTSQSAGTMTVRNNADTEVDYYLWPGLTASQKGSYTYKDWNGNSQWYMVKDASNNWALNSAPGGLDSFKAYQSTNSGDTYIDTSNPGGHIRLNYETGSGAETDIYSGSSSNLDAAFLGPTNIKFPGLAATSGRFCLQIDNSGYVTNTGSACGTGSGSTDGTINTGDTGQIAYYTTNGTTVGGMSAVPLSAGGTGASTAATALANLGGIPAGGGAMTGSLTAPGFIGPLTGNVTGSASGNLLPANNLSDVTSTAAAVSNLLPGISSDGKQGISAQGNVTAAQTLTQNSPYADIRAFGAVIDNVTDIGPALQSAINSFSWLPGHSATILLPCAGANGKGGGCYLDNPSALTDGNGGQFKILLQGYLRVGSTLVAPSWQDWSGNGSGFPTQFQNGEPGSIAGPAVYGTLGTAISTTNQVVTIAAPNFGQGNLAHLPAGSAMTIAPLATANATAVRTVGSYNGQTTFTLSGGPYHFVTGEVALIQNCSDATFNGAAVAIDHFDYLNQTVFTQQTTNTASTATGCTITTLNADARETVRILCANGTGINSNYTCGANQISIDNQFPHSASDSWGEVAVTPGFNTYQPQTWDSLSITACYGDCFWGDGVSNEYMSHMGMRPMQTLTGGTIHFSGSGYVMRIHNSDFEATGLGQQAPPCPGGNCTQPSYPYAFVCDSLPSGLFYGSGSQACSDFTVDDQSWVYGGVYCQPGGCPRFENTGFEEAPDAAVTIDNRGGGMSQQYNAFVMEHSFLQDSIYGSLCYLDYLTSSTPGGIFELNDLSIADSACLTNSYFNGTMIVKNIEQGEQMIYPNSASAPNGTFLEGPAISAEIRGSGANMSPSVLPFGSLPINDSISYWSSLCSGYQDCTVTQVPGPDGANGKMVAAELDYVSTYGGGIPIGTLNMATYAGDTFIFGSWVRPGANRSFTLGGQQSRNNSFSLYTAGTDTFAAQKNPNTALPTAFGTNIANYGWYPQVSVVKMATGESTAHNVYFYIDAGPQPGGGTGLGDGNEFAQPFWAFIPGPNNPACTAAGTCNVTIDQIMEARQDQYHGCVPANAPAGQAATCEATMEGGTTTANVTIVGAPSGSYVKADGTGYGTPSSQPPTGAAGGDLSGSYPNPAVAKINGGSVPASAAVVGTNSSGQPVSAATTGSGNVVLASSPTISAPTVSGTLSVNGATTMQGNVTLQNGANASQTLAIQPGASADQIGALQFNNYAGAGQWQLRKDASNYLRVTDAVNALDRAVLYQNGNTVINAGAGTNAVAINNASGSGTGGLIVYEGGSNSSTAALQVTGSGNTTATGFLQGKFMIGNGTMTLNAGAAAGTSASIGCATSHVCDGVSGTVTLTTGTSPTTGTLATLGFPNTHTNQANCIVTIESASAVITSNTWTESTTAITVTANAAPAGSTTYTLKYWCGGN
jgi:hypothetical protein